MKCPYRKEIITYYSEKDSRSRQEELFMNCYEKECPLWIENQRTAYMTEQWCARVLSEDGIKIIADK